MATGSECPASAAPSKSMISLPSASGPGKALFPLEFKDFLGEPCKGRTAFEFVPKQKKEVNVQNIAQRLRECQVSIEADTPFLLVLRHRNFPVSIAKNGKIMVRNTVDAGEAKKIFDELLEMLQ